MAPYSGHHSKKNGWSAFYQNYTVNDQGKRLRAKEFIDLIEPIGKRVRLKNNIWRIEHRE